MSTGSNDFFCANQSMVYDLMLGGGLANWSGTKDVGEGYDSKDFATELVDTLNNPFIAATYLMGLNANPTADAMAAAYKSARVFITGNFSNIHGGGIMCNGILLGGEVPTDEIHITVGAVTLPVDKIYLNKETGEKVPLNKDQFKFVLAKEVEVKDGKEIGRAHV